MLKIDRRQGEKLRLRGKVYGTMTVQLCNKEMRNIYGTSVIVRLEAKKSGADVHPCLQREMESLWRHRDETVRRWRDVFDSLKS